MKELIRDRIVIDESYAEECNRNSQDSGKLYVENVEETEKYYAKINIKKETPLGLKNIKHIEESNQINDEDHSEIIKQIVEEEKNITSTSTRKLSRKGGKK